MKRRQFLTLMGGAAIVAPFVPTARAEVVTTPDQVPIYPLKSYAFVVPDEDYLHKQLLIGYQDTVANGLVNRARRRIELLDANQVLSDRTRVLMASVDGVTWHRPSDRRRNK